jgi:hypothetical protein
MLAAGAQQRCQLTPPFAYHGLLTLRVRLVSVNHPRAYVREDMTPFYSALRADDVPFFMVSCPGRGKPSADPLPNPFDS